MEVRSTRCRRYGYLSTISRSGSTDISRSSLYEFSPHSPSIITFQFVDMAHIVPRRAPYVCKACRSGQIPTHLLRPFSSSSISKSSLRQQLQERSPDITSTKRTSPKQKLKSSTDGAFRRAQQAAEVITPVEPTKISPHLAAETHEIPNPRQFLKEIQEDSLDVLESDQVPAESTIQDILSRAQQLASGLIHDPASEPEQQQKQPQPLSQDRSASLFSALDEKKSRAPALRPQSTPTLSTTDRETYATQLAKTIYTLLEDPKIFISEPLLTAYTNTITTLTLPQYLPTIFHLYAHKPIPVPGSSPIKYRQPYSRAPKYAIPPTVINTALTSAINVRDLPLTIALIDLTVKTPAYYSAKFLRKAALPILGASSVIPLSYSLSQSAAMYQLSWEPETFFWMCLAGSTAYLGTMGTLLWITVTTWNDHHKRVRWVPGTPLTRRWMREEERLWFDRAAMAWGFQDENRHGEETGEEWEGLREVLGVRYLEVDRSSLLPGML